MVASPLRELVKFGIRKVFSMWISTRLPVKTKRKRIQERTVCVTLLLRMQFYLCFVDSTLCFRLNRTERNEFNKKQKWIRMNEWMKWIWWLNFSTKFLSVCIGVGDCIVVVLATLIACHRWYWLNLRQFGSLTPLWHRQPLWFECDSEACHVHRPSMHRRLADFPALSPTRNHSVLLRHAAYAIGSLRAPKQLDRHVQFHHQEHTRNTMSHRLGFLAAIV